MCSVENQMLLNESQITGLCKAYGLPTSNLKIISAIRIKNYAADTQAEIERLERDLRIGARSTNSNYSNQGQLSIDTHISNDNAARENILATSH